MAKLHISGIVTKKNKPFINKLKSKGTGVKPSELYNTKSYMKTMFWFPAHDKGIRESMTILYYQFHNISVRLLVGYVVYIHAFLINPLKLYQQIVLVQLFCEK